MRQRIFIIGALLLLVFLILWMVRDLFFSRAADQSNPWDYGMKSLKTMDTIHPAWKETMQIRPGLEEIYGVAVDTSGNIYISGKNGTEKYNDRGSVLNKFTFSGTAYCIHVNHQGHLFLGMEDHLEILDNNGRLLSTWASPGEGSVITSVASSGSSVFLADAGRKVVYHCSRNGGILNRIGEKDPEQHIPGFVIPSPYFDLGIDPGGGLWVVNPGRHTFEKYSSDGHLLSSWGKTSIAAEGFCGCCNPSHFTFLPDGSFVTSEKGIERIKTYSKEGEFQSIVALPTSFDEGTRGLDLATDRNGRIIVLDPARKMVRIFVKTER